MHWRQQEVKLRCIICNGKLDEVINVEYKSIPGWGHDFECHIGACAACYHVQQINPLSNDELIQYYTEESVSKVYERGQDLPPDSTIRRFDRYIDFFKMVAGKTFTDSFTWLDVGAHRNHYLSYFCSKFESCNGYGLDFVNPANIKNFYLRDISDDWWGKLPKFDIISGFHVLEHMRNPGNLFKGAVQLLNKDGLLMVEVPNLESRPTRNANYFYLEHIHYFTEKSIRLLADSCGFRCVGICAVSPQYDDDHRFEMPVLMAVFSPKPDDRTAAQYNSVEDLTQLYERIDHIKNLVAAGHQVVLWGSGMHTSFLLSRLEGLAVEICDSSPIRQGSLFGNIKIKSPTEVFTTYPNAICIPSSFSGNHAILSRMAKEFPAIKVFNLYE
jgi:hypothetical protein